ncbi:DUF2178 domain-containing protein [Halorientalis regularis]|uniref:Predicted membrane protein n=1 Tax=Halorientalis regularis TaxID=660518 RepID=A0A1G7SSG0_9EURY|nr:DUF2178 domain-containing protein [Halorientalis regularis]SDG26056.1 Predicted membrane protein [Halorientalis regularis]
MTELLGRAGRIRSAVAGLAAVSGLGLAAFTVLNRPFVAVGVYAVALAGAVGLQATADVPVFDERDADISRDAARWTLTIFGWASAGVFPALTVAWGLGMFEWQPWSVAIALFVAVLYLTYGALTFALGRRRSA